VWEIGEVTMGDITIGDITIGVISLADWFDNNSGQRNLPGG